MTQDENMTQTSDQIQVPTQALSPPPSLIFTNPGILPVLAVQTLGMSAKDSSGIGRFGTGLKYAIAGVLRLGGEIQIWTGQHLLEFSVAPTEVNGKEFQLVQMSQDGGEPDFLGFTTELGRHWAPWMLYRELWSNCQDAGGEDEPICAKNIDLDMPLGQTQVKVTGVLMNAHIHCYDFLLFPPPGQAPVFSCPKFELWNYSMREVYVKRVRVGRVDGFNLSFNALEGDLLPLTEDRNLPYGQEGKLAQILAEHLHQFPLSVAEELMETSNDFTIAICRAITTEGLSSDGVAALRRFVQCCPWTFSRLLPSVQISILDGLPSSFRAAFKLGLASLPRNGVEAEQSEPKPESWQEEEGASLNREYSKLLGAAYTVGEWIKLEQARTNYWKTLALALLPEGQPQHPPLDEEELLAPVHQVLQSED